MVLIQLRYFSSCLGNLKARPHALQKIPYFGGLKKRTLLFGLLTRFLREGVSRGGM